MIQVFSIAIAALLFLGCKSVGTSISSTSGSTLLFQSGFEPGSRVVAKNNDDEIIGADQQFRVKNDWVRDLDEHPEIGNFNLQYQGGDSTIRYARIIPEPGNPTNNILHFWLNQPNVNGSKGRIQANLYNNKGMKEFYQSVRMYLPADFNTVRTYTRKISWLTIAEFWNNITWSQQVPFGFRITLGIGKPTEQESDLFFIIDAQDCELFEDDRQKYTTIWHETNTAVKVPIAQWFTMEYFYKEGKDTDGRFYMAITPKGEKKQVIFDVRKTTHNTTDPAPDGVSDFNPMKLYTSKELIKHMNDNGKTLQIYWDDFKLWKNKQP